MRIFLNDGSNRQELKALNFVQTRQSIAVVDALARLIPQEGVDYDLEVDFKGGNGSSVSMHIVPHTDKGEWWREYVMHMIAKYPPTAENPPEAIKEMEDLSDDEKKEMTEGAENESNLS